MTDTPIIRAARALAKSDRGEDCYDGLDEAMQFKLQESARAVLEAVREPTFTMVSAAHNGPGLPTVAVSSGIWVRMIDAALFE